MKKNERLTAFVDLKKFCKYDAGCYGVVIRGNSRACDEAFQRYPFLPVAIDRLRRYEDTGLSPEEIGVMKHENDRLRIALSEAQRQELPAAEGRKIKCEIHITVEDLRGRDACQNDGKQKQRIPWEAD